jgi:hypothetical protein
LSPLVVIPILCNKFLSILKTPVVSTENLYQSPEANTELADCAPVYCVKNNIQMSEKYFFINSNQITEI